MLAADPARAFYGPGHVRAAAELGAVGTLLLSDSLLRVNDIQQARLLPPGCMGCTLSAPWTGPLPRFTECQARLPWRWAL